MIWLETGWLVRFAPALVVRRETGSFGMWHDLLVALALVFVIEGIMPFAAPEVLRRMMLDVAQQTNQGLRIAGFLSMASGVALLYLVN